MKHIHVAALEPDAEFAKKIGKKGSESDFTIYNCKEGANVVCMYLASKYPEKIQPLLYALSLCDAAYLRPVSIDKFLGEMIVACASIGPFMRRELLHESNMTMVRRDFFLEKHVTTANPFLFNVIADGMQKVVEEGTAKLAAKVEGIAICGKTGTVQNPHGAAHSAFVAFAEGVAETEQAIGEQWTGENEVEPDRYRYCQLSRHRYSSIQRNPKFQIQNFRQTTKHKRKLF